MAQEGGVQKLYEEVIMKSAATEVKAAYESAVEQYDEVSQWLGLGLGLGEG